MFPSHDRGAAQDIAYNFSHENPYQKVRNGKLLIWVISTEYQTIKSGIYFHLKEVLPEWEIKKLGPRVQGHDLPSYIESIRGDKIEFFSTKGGPEVRQKFQAAEVDYIYIDEEVDGWVWEELEARLITTGGKFSISATLVESYEWIVELEDRGIAGDPDVFLTRLRTQDNPHNDQKQIKRLEDQWDEETQAYRFEGHSRRSSGLIFKTWDKTRHIIPSFLVPEAWPKFHMFDPGFRVSAALWITISPKGQAFIYRTFYSKEAELSHTITEFQNLEQEQIDRKIIDDKIGSRTVSGEPGILETCAVRYQRYYEPALKQHHAGIEECRSWLKIDQNFAGQHEEYELDNGDKVKVPKDIRFAVFDDASHWFAWEIKQYRIKKTFNKANMNAPIDAPVKRNDHLIDCFKYWAVTRPSYFVPERTLPPIKQDVSLREGSLSLDQKIDIWWERKQKEKHEQNVDQFIGLM